jgi:hypothetical protein
MNGWRNLVLVAVAGACVVAHAGWPTWGRGRRVETLLVTGNFAKSRLLAELYQLQTKQPILLISPEGAGRDQLFFLPSVPEAMTLEPEKYAEWVEYLRPGRIIFLGDTAFVPAAYIDQVRGRFPTVVLNSRDWLDNAKALGSLIKDKGLAKLYGSYFEKLDAAAGGLRTGSEPPAAPAEPVALPRLAPPVRP